MAAKTLRVKLSVLPVGASKTRFRGRKVKRSETSCGYFYMLRVDFRAPSQVYEFTLLAASLLRCELAEESTLPVTASKTRLLRSSKTRHITSLHHMSLTLTSSVSSMFALMFFKIAGISWLSTSRLSALFLSAVAELLARVRPGVS